MPLERWKRGLPLLFRHTIEIVHLFSSETFFELMSNIIFCVYSEINPLVTKFNFLHDIDASM